VREGGRVAGSPPWGRGREGSTVGPEGNLCRCLRGKDKDAFGVFKEKGTMRNHV